MTDGAGARRCSECGSEMILKHGYECVPHPTIKYDTVDRRLTWWECQCGHEEKVNE